jgi:IS1 family transposase
MLTMSSKMVRTPPESQNMPAKPVVVHEWTTQTGASFPTRSKASLTASCTSAFRWPASRAVQVSESWLQAYVNEKYRHVPRDVRVRQKQCRLTIECAELWSFVGNNNHKEWVWLALDRDTRESVGVAIGARDAATARQLWDSSPPIYRKCAVCYSDFWDASACVLPSQRHRSVGKDSGQTSRIERLTNTLRQRISRLVRKTLSFSKKRENHIGAIWYFVHHDNASLA